MKIALLFPGYASQYVGMAKELYDESRIVQEYFEEASHCLDMNFVKLCFASSDVELARITHAYPALFLVSSAIQAEVRQTGVRADIVAGYGIGEYAALHAAGGFTFPDGLYLLNKLASFYQNYIQEHTVTALHVEGLSSKELETVCLKACVGNEQASIAIYYPQDEYVISGSPQGVENVRDLIVQSFPDATVSGVSPEFGVHSEQMNEVAKQFAVYLEKVDFKDLQVPLISSTDGQSLEKGTAVREEVIRLVYTPMRWDSVEQKIAEYDAIVEVGPGTRLRDMVKKHYPDKLVLAVNTWEDLATLKKLIVSENTEYNDQAED